jgi:hypothetical protein
MEHNYRTRVTRVSGLGLYIYTYLLWLIASFTHTSVQVVGTSPSAWDPLKSTFEARTYGCHGDGRRLSAISSMKMVMDGFLAPSVRRFGRLHRVKSGQWADLFEASYT